MKNRNTNVGAAADSSTPDEITTSSQTIAKPNVVRCLSWCIDRYCIANSFFQDRISITKEYVLFSGSYEKSWSGYDKNLKSAIIKSSKSCSWKIIFWLFPNCYYQKIIDNLFQRLTIKEYDYTPKSVQLIRTNGSGDKKLYHPKFKDGRFWFCILNREKVNVKRSSSWSVTHCLNTLS